MNTFNISLRSRDIKKHILFDFRESYVLDFEKCSYQTTLMHFILVKRLI